MNSIALIEDDQDVRETTAEILELADYKVVTAENGKEGVEVCRLIKPDLIICDITMPDLDGYGVLRILSKNPETSNIPFIFLTARSEARDMRKGMNLGADDFITKPFQEAELLEAVEVRLKKQQQLKNKLNPENIGQQMLESSGNGEGLKELLSITEDRKVKSVRKKEVIYREDDKAEFLFYILSGRVKCIQTDNYGKDFVSDLHGEGEFIGYLTVMDQGEYHETAIAIEPTKVAIIPRQDFLNLILKNVNAATNFIQLLTVNVKDREKRLLQLAYASVRERVAHSLIRLIDRGKGDHLSKGKIRISREDLANIIGTAKESLIRTLSDMKKEDILDTEGQEIIILNEQKLRKIVATF